MTKTSPATITERVANRHLTRLTEAKELQVLDASGLSPDAIAAIMNTSYEYVVTRLSELDSDDPGDYWLDECICTQCGDTFHSDELIDIDGIDPEDREYPEMASPCCFSDYKEA